MGSALDICDNQFGFKAKTSTIHAAFLLQSVVRHHTTRGSTVYACFVDAKKAFDRVNSYKALDKLLARGAPGYIVRFLYIWYTNMTMKVLWDKSVGHSFAYKNGVRQGSCLSPLLFAVYIDDALKKVRSVKLGLANYSSSLIINIMAFADDIVLVAPTISGLQILLNQLIAEFGELQVEINTDKTKVMGFGSCDRRWSLPCHATAVCNGILLERVTSYKYLGVTMTCDLTSSLEIDIQWRKLLRKGYCILNKFGVCENSTLGLLLTSFAFSLYGCELYFIYLFIYKRYRHHGAVLRFHKYTFRTGHQQLPSCHLTWAIAAGRLSSRMMIAPTECSVCHGARNNKAECPIQVSTDTLSVVTHYHFQVRTGSDLSFNMRDSEQSAFMIKNNGCRTFLNGALCIAQNCLKTMPALTVVDVLVEKFDEDQLSLAKRLLYATLYLAMPFNESCNIVWDDATVSTVFGKFVDRRGQHKKKNDAEDIVKLLQRGDAQVLKLPMFTTNDVAHFVTSIANQNIVVGNVKTNDDVTKLSSEVQEIKNTLKQMCDSIKVISQRHDIPMQRDRHRSLSAKPRSGSQPRPSISSSRNPLSSHVLQSTSSIQPTKRRKTEERSKLCCGIGITCSRILGTRYSS